MAFDYYDGQSCDGQSYDERSYDSYSYDGGSYDSRPLELPKLVVPAPDFEAESMIIEDLVTLHAKLLYELPRFPEGTLIERRRGRQTYYSVQTTINHTRRDRYLSRKRDTSLIELLKQKKLIRSALTKIRKASRHFKGYRRRLAAKLSIIGRRHAENYIYYTNKIYACSTAEAAIVEMLHKRRVRFEYAVPTLIGGWINSISSIPFRKSSECVGRRKTSQI